VNDKPENVLGTVERGDIVQVVRIQKEVIHDLKLCRLEKHGATIVRKRPIVIDGVVSVALVYRDLFTNKHTVLQCATFILLMLE